MDLVDKMVRWRRAGRLTQEQAAELLGFSARTVRNWEARATIPRGRARAAIEALLESLEQGTLPAEQVRVLAQVKVLLVEIPSEGLGLYCPLPGLHHGDLAQALQVEGVKNTPPCADVEESPMEDLTETTWNDMNRLMNIALQRKVHDKSPLEGGRSQVTVQMGRHQAAKLRRYADHNRASASEVIRALVELLPDEDDTG